MKKEKSSGFNENSSSKLWGGRFQKKAHPSFKKFNCSLNFDYRLAEQDIIGSIAWVEALEKAKILKSSELKKISDLLNDLLQKVKKNPKFILDSQFEDIHTYVEDFLTKNIGDLGKKLHTGRSRNGVSQPLEICYLKSGNFKLYLLILQRKIKIR
jgi:argininosuccinate lyase